MDSDRRAGKGWDYSAAVGAVWPQSPDEPRFSKNVWESGARPVCQKGSNYGANHKSKGLPTGFRYCSSLLESARMATEDPGQLAAAVGVSRARTRFAVSCRGDSHLSADAQPLTRVGLSNLCELTFGLNAFGVLNRRVLGICRFYGRSCTPPQLRELGSAQTPAADASFVRPENGSFSASRSRHYLWASIISRRKKRTCTRPWNSRLGL